MSGYGVTYKLTVCYPKPRLFKNCSNFHMHEEEKEKLLQKIAFSWEFVSLHKNNNSLLLLLFNFIGHRCLNLNALVMLRCYSQFESLTLSIVEWCNTTYET